MVKRQINFTEETYQSGKPIVDREEGVIRGVKILGRVSKNGREYTPQAIQECAAAYEGISVNANHPDRSTPNANRSVQDGIGWLEGIQTKDDGVYGDLHVIKSHPLASTLFEVAERKPDRFGLSHNASGESVERGGKRIIESVSRVRSVDLVQNPATVQSLFESEDPVPQTKTISFGKLLESLSPKGRERKVLTELMEMDGLPMVTPEMPVEVASEGSSPTADEAAKAAFKTAISAILDDDAITWEETKARIIEMVKTLAKMSGGDAEVPAEAPVPESGGEEPMTESLQEQLNDLKQKLADKEQTEFARTLLESKGVIVKPSRVVTLKATSDKRIQAELLEDWLKADGPKQKPVSGRPATSRPVPLMESEDSQHKPAKGAEAMRKAYR